MECEVLGSKVLYVPSLKLEASVSNQLVGRVTHKIPLLSRYHTFSILMMVFSLLLRSGWILAWGLSAWQQPEAPHYASVFEQLTVLSKYENFTMAALYEINPDCAAALPPAQPPGR